MTQLGEFFKKHKEIIIMSCLTILCIVSALFVTEKPDGKELTKGQIDAVNTHFEQLIPMQDSSEFEYMVNPICHFFSSDYDDVSEIDMGEFVYYIPRESYLTEDDTKEIAKLQEAGFCLPFGKIEDSPIPFGRVPYETVESYLHRYANVNLADMKNMGGAIYSDEYQCFYTYTSDFGPGHFRCIGGRVEGDMVTLDSETAVLKLKRDKDRYYILSHRQK